jgi:hypothetical protein
VTRNNNAGPYGHCNWNEYKLKLLASNDWRASLVPAAAVIPAPIAYIKVVAVKKLVVEIRMSGDLLHDSVYRSTQVLRLGKSGFLY